MKRLVCVHLGLLLAIFNISAAAAQKSLDQGIATLSEVISKQVVENRKKKIVVVPFSTREGRVSALGSRLADELITQLISDKKFVVVERQERDRVIKENNLNKETADEQFKSVLISKLKVDAIVLGTITEFPQSVRINARVISVDTGEILAAASTEIAKDEAVVRLLGQSSPVIPQSYADNPAVERIEIGNRKSGTIIEQQHRDYKVRGVTNSPLIFTVRAEECAPNSVARYWAGIFDSRGRKLKEPMLVYCNRVREILFTPAVDSQYIVRIEGAYGRCRFTVFLDRP